MMNRVLGTICAIAIIGVIAFAVLNYGNYRSMLFETEPAESVVAVPEAVLEIEPEPMPEVEVVEIPEATVEEDMAVNE